MSHMDVVAFIGALVIAVAAAVATYLERRNRRRGAAARQPEPERDVETWTADIRAQVPPARPYSRLYTKYHPAHSRKGGRGDA